MGENTTTTVLATLKVRPFSVPHLWALLMATCIAAASVDGSGPHTKSPMPSAKPVPCVGPVLYSSSSLLKGRF